MATTFKLKVAGLFLDDNSLDETPEGALSDGTNLAALKPDVLESRRGLANLNYSVPAVTQIHALHQPRVFGLGTLFANGGDGKLYRQSGSGWSSPMPSGVAVLSGGTIAAGAYGYGTRWAEAGGALFARFSQGTFKIDAMANAPVLAGLARGLDSLGATIAGSWLSAGNQVAYRTIFVRYDANNNRIVSAPSGRVIVQNNGAVATGGHLYIPIPADILSTDWVEVYRTRQTGVAVDPGEEMQLCYAAPVGVGPGPGVPISFSDVTPDTQLGASGYFCPSQDGIIQGASRPPRSNDIALFKGCLFFGGVSQRGQAILQLIAVPSDGDTIEIGGIVYTWRVAPVAGGDVQIFSGGTLSQNITNCANALIYTINNQGYPATGPVVSTVYASYISSPTDNPGKILFENITPGVFTILGVGHTSNWFPDIGSQITSSGQYGKNRLMWSKNGQFEAVPYLNYQDIGDGEIQRLVPLRDSLLIFKTDGCWRLTGAGGIWNIQPLDPNLKPVNAETICSLNNRAFGWFNQGVCAVSDAGAQSLSFGRCDQFLQALTVSPEFLDGLFGVGHEKDRNFILAYGGGKALVYNLFTDSWTNTKFPVNVNCGEYGADGVLRFGVVSGAILSEKTRFDGSDHADWKRDVTIAMSNGFGVLNAGQGAGCSIGEGLYQLNTNGTIGWWTILAKNGDTLTLSNGVAIGKVTHVGSGPDLLPQGLPPIDAGHLYEFRVSTPGMVGSTAQVQYRIDGGAWSTSFVPQTTPTVIDGHLYVKWSVIGAVTGTETWSFSTTLGALVSPLDAPAAGRIDHCAPLAENVTWQPTAAGQPDAGKQFQMLVAYCGGALPTDLTASFSSDIQGAAVATASMSMTGGTNPGVSMTLVPRDHARANRLQAGLSHATIFEKVVLLGVALKHRVTGEGAIARG